MSTVMQNQILKEIVRKRHELGYSQDFMARKLWITQSQYSKIESGSAKLSTERMSQIFQVLEIELAHKDTRSRREMAFLIHKLFSESESINRIRSVVLHLDEIIKEYRKELDELGPHHFISNEETA
jgi:transcriptional regulator with XRE-family HTH domain